MAFEAYIRRSIDLKSDRPGLISSGLTVFFVFLTITLVPVLLGLDEFSLKYADMRDHHAPTIEIFAQQLPYFDFSDYGSATTPGLHVALAFPVWLFGPSETLLQAFSCLFGAVLIGVAWWFGSRVLPPWLSAIVVIPLLCNTYVISGSIWLMTGNTSLILIAIAIGCCLFFTPTIRTMCVVGISLICSILVRQTSLWIAAGAWLSTAIDHRVLQGWIPEPQKRPWTAGPMVVISIAILIALALLIWFFVVWSGLVPPRYQTLHGSGVNTAVPLVILTSLAVYAFPFVCLHAQRLLLSPAAAKTLLFGAVCGLVLGVTLESTPGIDAGRFGGWVWKSAGLMPVIGGRSVLLVLGAMAGGVTAAALHVLVSANAKRGTCILIWLFSISYILAMTANSQSFQRYYDGPILLGIAWIIALSRRPDSPTDDRRILISCCVMGGVQLSMSWYSVYSTILNG